jgi:hypothetical protein
MGILKVVNTQLLGSGPLCGKQSEPGMTPSTGLSATFSP